MDKIDPKLQRLIAAHAAGELPANPENPEHLVHVYVTAVGGDFSGLASAGYDLVNELAGSVIVILPIDQIETLAARDDVTAVIAPPVGRPQAVVHTVDQKAVKLQKAYEVKSTAKPTGTKGAGVVVGIIDSGVNVLHDAFRTAAPDRKTRILFYWAQDDTIRPGAGPLWDRMGKVYTAADIDAEIAAHPSGHGMPDALMDWGNEAKTESGHGTGVASVAAASEWPKDPPAAQVLTGVAPETQLIVVSGLKDDQAGIEFCYAKAEALAPPKPCAVNMSLGDHRLPHNGRTLFDARVNTLLTAKAGRVLVVAAGNEGNVHNHARVSLPHPGSVTFDVSVGPEEFALECLISGTKTGGVIVTVAPPLRRAGDARTFFKHNEIHKEDGHDRHKVTTSFAGAASDPDWHTFVRVASVADPTVRSNWYVRTGTWQVKLETFQQAQPDVDIWLSNIDDNQKIKPLPGSTPAKEEQLDSDASYRRPREWILHTLRSPACGKDAIVVGSGAVGSVSSLIGPHRGSSRGPSTDASIPALKWKPDLIAPGVDVRVAKFTKAATAAGRPTSTSRVTSGSSFAAPFVTGTAALMLAHDPALKQADVLKFIRVNIDPMMSNAKVTAWMNKYDIGDPTIIGEGFLNMENAVASVSDTP